MFLFCQYFFVKKEYFEALERHEKYAEIRVGKYWLKVAMQIMNGTKKPLAVFRCGSRKLVMEIKNIDVFPNIKRALSNKRWKKLGLHARTFKSAVNEITKLYRGKNRRPVIIFWLKQKTKK